MPYKDLDKKREVARSAYYSNRTRILRRKRAYYIENLERIQAYRDANRHKLRTRDRERYYANHEKKLQRGAEYRSKNPDKCREATRKWRLKNPKYTTRYYAKNPGKSLALYAKRIALKNRVTLGDLLAIEKIYDRAKELRKWFDVAVDHIIPLAKEGIHAATNLQIIYRRDNLSKHCKMGYKPSVIFS